jgi:hypothetical protein
MKPRMIRRTKKGASMATGMMPQEIHIPGRIEIGKPPGTQKIAIPPGLLTF